jgi:hypothetical protein
MKDNEQFENAGQFLGCYFHQDFSFEFGEPEVAVKKFIADSDGTLRAAVAQELRQVIAECDDRKLTDFVFLELGCYYSPERHRGVPMREWLNQIIAALEQSLSD